VLPLLFFDRLHQTTGARHNWPATHHLSTANSSPQLRLTSPPSNQQWPDYSSGYTIGCCGSSGTFAMFFSAGCPLHRRRPDKMPPHSASSVPLLRERKKQSSITMAGGSMFVLMTLTQGDRDGHYHDRVRRISHPLLFSICAHWRPRIFSFHIRVWWCVVRVFANRERRRLQNAGKTSLLRVLAVSEFPIRTRLTPVPRQCY
jgi:hypothetical protein